MEKKKEFTARRSAEVSQTVSQLVRKGSNKEKEIFIEKVLFV